MNAYSDNGNAVLALPAIVTTFVGEFYLHGTDMLSIRLARLFHAVHCGFERAAGERFFAEVRMQQCQHEEPAGDNAEEETPFAPLSSAVVGDDLISVIHGWYLQVTRFERTR